MKLIPDIIAPLPEQLAWEEQLNIDAERDELAEISSDPWFDNSRAYVARQQHEARTRSREEHNWMWYLLVTGYDGDEHSKGRKYHRWDDSYYQESEVYANRVYIFMSFDRNWDDHNEWDDTFQRIFDDEVEEHKHSEEWLAAWDRWNR